ncbi:DUF3152 domain-containing protein [Micromonospora sp. BRA006-A]|nr:DUF3152 domain-containing protein [Micromonospora sp. BRA006-A]
MTGGCTGDDGGRDHHGSWRWSWPGPRSPPPGTPPGIRTCWTASRSGGPAGGGTERARTGRAPHADGRADTGPGGRPGGPGIGYPARGDGTFRTAGTVGAVAGSSGELLRYRVAVEDGIRNVDVEGFARDVAATLADRRGWTGDGRWRLQRVGRDDRADFTVLLTTPVTRGGCAATRATATRPAATATRW